MVCIGAISGEDLMRKIVLAFAAALVAGAAVASHGQSPSALTVEGLGPVKIGMTLAEVERALGTKLSMYYLDDTDPNACGTGNRADGKNADVYYLLEDGKLARIEIVTLDTGTPTVPAIRTAKGIGLGSTEAQVKAAYPGVKVEPHPYLEDAGHYMVVKSADGKTGIIFETDTKTVIEFRAGAYPQVGYIEGCA
jgi:hypothetical protein